MRQVFSRAFVFSLWLYSYLIIILLCLVWSLYYIFLRFLLHFIGLSLAKIEMRYLRNLFLQLARLLLQVPDHPLLLRDGFRLPLWVLGVWLEVLFAFLLFNNFMDFLDIVFIYFLINMINVAAAPGRVSKATLISAYFSDLADPLLQSFLDSFLPHQLPLFPSLIHNLQEVIQLWLSVLGFPDSLLVLKFFNESQLVHLVLMDQVLLILESSILLDSSQNGFHIGVHHFVVLLHELVNVYRVLPCVHFAIKAEIQDHECRGPCHSCMAMDEYFAFRRLD